MFLVWIAIASAAVYVSQFIPEAIYVTGYAFAIAFIGMGHIERRRHPHKRDDA
jgi:hypothetical protein